MVLDMTIRTVRFLFEKDFRGTVKKVVVVVALLIAFRHTLAWQLGDIWRASANLSETLYTKYYVLFGSDVFNVGVWGMFAATTLAFWAVALVFLIVDVTGRPTFIKKYKVQPEENDPIPTDKLLKCLAVVLYNQFVIGLSFLYVLHHLFRRRGCSFDPGDLPTFKRFLLEALVFLIIEEIGFYYGHRLLHHPTLYKHFHKIHHEWTAPIAAVTIYCHPLEHVLANLIPAMMGPLVMGSHFAVMLLWGVSAQTTAMIHHCGYHLPLMSSPEAHDFHHLKFNQNFGVLGILDRLHGTDTLFRNSKQQYRHFLLLSLTPLTTLVPDNP
ncbi:Fatty acid hydroxylase domain-containing protein 2 [Holothuria leucospilota]|uniref:Fatty acid hydroxylase domain-containing protein 2 n=1 Tax=Holothuria leucospilota TaxID=206669 RepID=A0A9Q1GZH0_HOLLE|nr:Fatty acid hydroxylase domain-containing protein 2 [Holothuria leucospilota]